MGTQKRRNAHGMALDSRVKTIARVIKIGIEIYIKTYGETDSPSGKSVDMPRLKKLLREHARINYC